MKIAIFYLTDPEYEQVSGGAFPVYRTIYRVPILEAYAIHHSSLELQNTSPDSFEQVIPDFEIKDGCVSFVSQSTLIRMAFEKEYAVLEIHYSGIRDYSLLFPYVEDLKLRQRLGQFAEEADKAFESYAWMSYVMMVGAVVEGLLFNTYGKASFAELIKRGKLDNLFDVKEVDTINTVRDLRNRIHADRFKEDYASRKIALDLSVIYDRLLKNQWQEAPAREPSAGRSYYGLDGCKAGWFYVCFVGDQLRYGVVETFQEILERKEDQVIFIDIPIGLASMKQPVRLCDEQARQLLGGKRSSSVFSMPVREVVDIGDFATANEQNKQLTGKGISKQGFGILPKVREVDKLLSLHAKGRDAVREAHPELCFLGLAGKPMKFNKATPEGFSERLGVLERYRKAARTEINNIVSECKSSKVAADDIVDAYVCALSASMEGDWTTIPLNPQKDDRGLMMAMTYCRPIE